MVAELWNDNLVWRLFSLPIGWRLWVFWLMTVNSACVLFLDRKPARVVGVAWVGNIITMMTMYWALGYVRLLGLAHVLWWTPLFAWLVPRAMKEKPAGAYGVWLWLLVASDLTSLAIDYVDVARYLLGERTPA